MNFDLKALKQNPHLYLSQFEELMGLRFIEEGYYGGVYALGKFDGNFDYNLGLMWVHISNVQYPEGYSCLFTIGNIDDGLWQAWSKYSSSKPEIDILIKDVSEAFREKWSFKLPDTAEELNEFLKNYKLFGEFTG